MISAFDASTSFQPKRIFKCVFSEISFDSLEKQLSLNISLVKLGSKALQANCSQNAFSSNTVDRIKAAKPVETDLAPGFEQIYAPGVF